MGTRPSYAWRSIMHGRELLKEGLAIKLGDGRDTKVWMDNWLLEPVPRPPRYRMDAVVDLTLTVNDLFDMNTNSWNIGLIHQLIVPEDIDLVLRSRLNLSRSDTVIWGCSPNGHYDTKSGYKLSEKLALLQTDTSNALPPLEKQLWSKLWKAKTPPKLRHFLWRVVSGALAVKDQLRTRGIHIDATCSACLWGPETICHMLFHCENAKAVWNASNFPLPPAGWSSNSVFLNIHYLLSCSHKQNIGPSIRLAFPWILWQIWKARNKFCFEQVRPLPTEVLSKAMDEALVWLNLHGHIPGTSPSMSVASEIPTQWCKPPRGFLKCNIGSVWSPTSLTAGGGWIIRDSAGKTLWHSRRAFSGIRSKLQADLLVISWAASAARDLRLKKIIFEFSSPQAEQALGNPLVSGISYQACHDVLRNIFSTANSTISSVPDTCNFAATAIGTSATNIWFQQSYLASNGPQWLAPLLAEEAVGLV